MAKWLGTALLLALSACAVTPEAPPAAPQDEASKPISSVEPAVPEVLAPRPAPKPAHPKARRKDKAVDKERAAKGVEAAQSAPQAAPPAPAPEPARAESVAKTQVIKGPAWLARCASKSREGGVILCDADSLLVQPSLSVKVYTREAALAGKVASGVIVLRANLPRRYRIYFVP